MTVSTVRRPQRTGRRGAFFGLHSGQVVALEIGLAVGAYGGINLRPATAWTVPVGAVIATVAVLPWRGRWAYEWIVLAVGQILGARRRSGPDPLDAVLPGAAVESDEDGAATIVTTYGHTAVLELLVAPGDLVTDGDMGLGTGWAAAISAIIAPAADEDLPVIGVQVVAHLVPAPRPAVAASVPGTSYRDLTSGQVPARASGWLAVTAYRGAMGWTDEALRATVTRAVGRAERELARLGLGYHRLSASGIHETICGLVPSGAVRARWSDLRVGPVTMATQRIHRWPAGGEGLWANLSADPAAAVTTSVSLHPLSGTESRSHVAIRLTGSARSVDAAGATLRRQISRMGGSTRRYAGAQLAGLTDTLPLGSPPAAAATHRVSLAAIEALGTPVPAAGVMLGRNRREEPVTVRLLRATPTRAVLYGGPTAAGLLALRTLAVGGHVGVQTTRPRAWTKLVAGCAGLPLHLVPLGQPLTVGPSSPDQPQLIITDAARQPVNLPPDSTPWRTHLVVRDELTPDDVDVLAGAQLVLLPPVPPDSAAFLAHALGLPEAADWLPRIRPDMLAVITRAAGGRRPSLHWARLAHTATESQLLVTLS